jgi:hypothetical protein
MTGVTELDLSLFGIQEPSGRRLSGVTFLPGLRRLNLAGNAMDRDWIGHTTTALRPSLTGLTYLNMARTNVTDRQLAVMAPFLPSLEHLDLEACDEINIIPEDALRYLGRHDMYLVHLKALTHLNLSHSARVGDDGMRLLAEHLPALTHLQLNHTAVTHRGVSALGRFRLTGNQITHLAFQNCGDSELLAVSSLTGLTRLDMYDCRLLGYGGLHTHRVSEEGMSHLSCLTRLTHLELENEDSEEALVHLSSLTALSHLRLHNPCYGDEGMRALACLTNLTHLEYGWARLRRRSCGNGRVE